MTESFGLELSILAALKNTPFLSDREVAAGMPEKYQNQARVLQTCAELQRRGLLVPVRQPTNNISRGWSLTERGRAAELELRKRALPEPVKVPLWWRSDTAETIPAITGTLVEPSDSEAVWVRQDLLLPFRWSVLNRWYMAAWYGAKQAERGEIRATVRVFVDLESRQVFQAEREGLVKVILQVPNREWCLGLIASIGDLLPVGTRAPRAELAQLARDESSMEATAKAATSAPGIREPHFDRTQTSIRAVSGGLPGSGKRR